MPTRERKQLSSAGPTSALENEGDFLRKENRPSRSAAQKEGSEGKFVLDIHIVLQLNLLLGDRLVPWCQGVPRNLDTEVGEVTSRGGQDNHWGRSQEQDFLIA